MVAILDMLNCQWKSGVLRPQASCRCACNVYDCRSALSTSIEYKNKSWLNIAKRLLMAIYKFFGASEHASTRMYHIFRKTGCSYFLCGGFVCEIVYLSCKEKTFTRKIKNLNILTYWRSLSVQAYRWIFTIIVHCYALYNTALPPMLLHCSSCQS